MGDNPTYQRKRRLRGQTPGGGPGVRAPGPQARGRQDPDPPRRSTRPAIRGRDRLIGPNDKPRTR